MRPEDDRELLRTCVAAVEWLRKGCWREAQAGCDRALQRLDESPVDELGGLSPMRRQMHLVRAEALVGLGKPDLARQALVQAVPGIDEGHPAAASPDVMRAMALALLGRLQFAARQPAAMTDTIQAALRALPEGGEVGDSAAPLRGRIFEMMAVGLGVGGDHEAALRWHAQALAIFEHPLQGELARDRGMALINAGNAHWFAGRHDDALRYLYRGLAVLNGLIDAGSHRERPYACMARMNIAGVLLAMRDFDAAVSLYGDVAKDYDSLIGRTRVPADAGRLRASRAQTEMNWAYALFCQGSFDAAATHYRKARSRYARLSMTQPQLRDDEARTWINQAHLLARQGRAHDARRLYRRSWTALQAMLDSGRTHLAADVANARLGMARTSALVGDAAAAARHFSEAQHSLVALTQQGQLQHARHWLVALADQADAVLSGCATAPKASQALMAALSRPPQLGLCGFDTARREIEEALVRLATWSTAAATGRTPWLADFSTSILAHLLDRTALLLGESDPDVLRMHQADAAEIVARLRDAALALPKSSLVLADWFLRTRGLRAQRSALAEGKAPELAVLRERLRRLRRLEEEILGHGAAAALPADPAHPSGLRQNAAEWQDLHDECEVHRRRVVLAGLLPSSMRLDACTLAARLHRRSALVMLARGAPGELVVIALYRRGEVAASALHSVVRLDAAVAALDGARALRQLRQVLHPRGEVLRLGADSIPPGEGASDCDTAMAEDLAQRLYQQVATHALRPMLQQLAARGLLEVALVPSADLHLLPYHELLVASLQETGCRLTVWPSCGAFAQHCLLGPTRPPTAAPVWALVARSHLDGQSPLPWVVLEQSLSQHLWQVGNVKPLATERPQVRGVSALLGMGHGSAPQDDLSRAGLLTGPGEVFCAHDLPAVRTCHRVLLSCCVLGRVDEVHTEALGFLSSSFGYRTSFGAGWLVEVPDAEACLFSLAFQFALWTAYAAQQRQKVRWIETFETTRRGIRQGHWPTGFGPWLEAHLPMAVAASGLAPGSWLNRYEYLRDFQGGLFAHPPPGLQRLMVWVVALGR